MEKKHWFHSKTIWIAVLEMVGGAITLVIAYLTENPEFSLIGLAGLLVGIKDLFLRFKTSAAIK